MKVAWVDASSGAAGDMVLGALLGAGVDLDGVRAAVTALGVPVAVRARQVTAHGLAAWRVDVTSDESHPPRRTWADVQELLDRADLDDATRGLAHEVFRRLAVAEAAVHGSRPEDVHFHEVGAHDAVADVVGCAFGFTALGLDRVVVSPIALGSGSVRTAHGRLPVPVPAVLELLRLSDAPSYGGPVDAELCTPTGAAVLTTVAHDWGVMPPMRVTATGSGAGSRDLGELPNVVRLVVGEAAGTPEPAAVLLATNVDDLDPRLWPGVLHQLLEAGASDAWLTPILMKKGRPAHELSVLAPAAAVDALRRVVFRETSSLGLREQPVGKAALQRRWVDVDVDGQALAVKLGLLDGEVVNAQPEWEHVARAAQALGRPAKVVLAQALAAVHGRPAGSWDPVGHPSGAAGAASPDRTSP